MRQVAARERHRVDQDGSTRMAFGFGTPFKLGPGQGVRLCKCGALMIGPSETLGATFIDHVLAGCGLA